MIPQGDPPEVSGEAPESLLSSPDGQDPTDQTDFLLSQLAHVTSQLIGHPRPLPTLVTVAVTAPSVWNRDYKHMVITCRHLSSGCVEATEA